MSDRLKTIQKHTADILALERHILEAVERQRSDDDAHLHEEANAVLIELERTLKSHVASLENLVKSYEGETESMWKKAISEAMGVAAGLYDKVREHKVSRMLRDDYTALSLAAMGYTAYHTLGLAIKEQRVADLALAHLKDLTPVMVRISKVLPHVIAEELLEDNKEVSVDATVGKQAEENTQQAWRPDVTHV